MASHTPQRQVGLSSGLLIAMASAIAFGLSGPVGRSLLDAGWSSAAVALVRVGGGAAVLAIPTVISLMRSRSAVAGWAPAILAYGAVAIAGAQLCFFTAIQYAPVSSVLLVEYLAPVLLIGWTWLRTRTAPSSIVLVGAAVAVSGLVVVIGIGTTGDTSLLGLAWAFGAAVCLTCYFAIAGSRRAQPPALTLTGAGMIVGALLIAAAGLVGILDVHAGAAQVLFGGVATSWLVPVATLVGVCAVLAYLAGVMAVRRLGARTASFVSLTEVVFALTAAWLLLGEQPTGRQGVGAVIVLTGILLVQVDSDRARSVVTGAWWSSVDVIAPVGRAVARHTARAVRIRPVRRVRRAIGSHPRSLRRHDLPGRRRPTHVAPPVLPMSFNR